MSTTSRTGAKTAPKPGKRHRPDNASSPETSEALPSIRLMLEKQSNQFEASFSKLEANFADHARQIMESVEELKKTVQFQSEEIEDLKHKVDMLEQEVEKRDRELEEEVDKLATYVARENLVFFGIGEEKKAEEDVEKVLLDFYVTKLKIEPERAKAIEYQRVHRIPSAKGPRPIKARYLRYADKVLIQKHAKNLKGNKERFFIADDLPKRVRNKRQAQLPAFQAARKAGKLAFFSKSEPPKLFVDHVWLRKEKQGDFVYKLQGAVPKNPGRNANTRRSSRERSDKAARTTGEAASNTPLGSRDTERREVRGDLAPRRASRVDNTAADISNGYSGSALDNASSYDLRNKDEHDARGTHSQQTPSASIEESAGSVCVIEQDDSGV